MSTTRMKEARTQARGVTRRLVALALVLWLGGAGCLVGCGTAVFAAPVGEAPGADESRGMGEGESCPLYAGHDCCRRAQIFRGGQASVESSTPIAPMMGCCPLAGQKADPVRKARLVDAPDAVALNRPLSVSPVVALPATPPPGQRRVPDRGGTHLRCCVFLI